jgi:hypothetical protein
VEVASGGPRDNNIRERALKKAILHRKSGLFYKTRHGAKVGDIYMSLIHTRNVRGANPRDHFTELERHAAQVAATTQNRDAVELPDEPRCGRVANSSRWWRVPAVGKLPAAARPAQASPPRPPKRPKPPAPPPRSKLHACGKDTEQDKLPSRLQRGCVPCFA